MSSEIVKSYIWSADVIYSKGAGQSIQFMSAEESITPRLLETFAASYRISGLSGNEPVLTVEEPLDLQITSIRRASVIYGDVGACHRLSGRGSILRLASDGAILDVNVERAEKLSGLS